MSAPSVHATAALGSAQSVQDVITDAVEALRLARQESKRELAAVLDVSPAQITRRYQGTAPWTSVDLQYLVEHFRVPLAVLVTPARTGLMRRSAAAADSTRAPREIAPTPAVDSGEPDESVTGK